MIISNYMPFTQPGLMIPCLLAEIGKLIHANRSISFYKCITLHLKLSVASNREQKSCPIPPLTSLTLARGFHCIYFISPSEQLMSKAAQR